MNKARTKVMISQPMNGISEDEIVKTHKNARVKLTRKGYEVVDQYLGQCEASNRIACLGLSIETMAECQAVYFCNGWEDARGCRIEHEVAEEYGLDIIYAEDEEEPKAPITDDQKTFMEGMNHAEMVLDEYFDMVLNAWSGCADEYQRSAKIMKNGVIKWLTAAKFERYTDFVKENESKRNE
jgi:hypothetical protein